MSGSAQSEGRRYHVLEALGKGGFGTVYRAELEAAGGFRKPVALKILNEDMEGMADIVNRLRDEARMLGLLQHRAIVNVDGLVYLDGRWTVVMEYVEGVSLAQILEKKGPVPPRIALAIVEEVASALHSAYARAPHGGEPLGLLHRDIKPANIQLTVYGDVKLLDFGVARANFSEREAKTERMIFGSLPYMAPERFERNDVHASDVYALTATLAELLTGEPLDRAALHPERFAEQIADVLRDVERTIADPELSQLLRDGLAYEHERRPDARAVEERAHAIGERLRGEPLKRWAEAQLPHLLKTRSLTREQLSGSTLIETSGAHAVSADTAWVDDEPLAAAAPVARGRSPLRGCLLGLSVGGLSVGAVIVAVVLMLTASCAAICVPLWGPSVQNLAFDRINELRLEASALPDTEERQAFYDLLDDYGHVVAKGNLGLMQTANFEGTLESALEDGVLTSYEIERARADLERLDR